MTMVLSPEESNYFSSSSFRRFHSQPRFVGHQPSYSESPQKSKNNSGFDTIISPTNHAPSLAPSSSRTLHADSTTPSHAPSPSNNLLLNTSTEEDQLIFPFYHDIEFYSQVKDLEPLESLRISD